MTRFLARLLLIPIALGLLAPAASAANSASVGIPAPQSSGPARVAAGAKTVHPSFGFPGTESIRDLCDAGQYLVGLSVRAGSWWDQVQIKCAPMAGPGQKGPATEPRRPRGGNGGQGPVFYDCGENGWLTQAHIILNTNGQVAYVYLGCSRDPKSSGAPVNMDTAGSKFADGQRQKQKCPVGEAGTGFEIHYSQYVNALGLVCDPFTGQAAPSAADVAFAEQRKDEMKVTGKTTDQCQASNMACVSRVTTQYGAAKAPEIIATECQPYVAQCMANAVKASEDANREFAEQRAWEVQVTGKTAAECAQSNSVCEARALQYGHQGSASYIGYIVTECRPYFAQCMANAPKAEADAAAARKAFEEQIKEERRVTGKTFAECQIANQTCEARYLNQYGPIASVGLIASDCRPIFAQCMGNAQAAAAAADANNAPPVQAPTGNGAPATSVCGLPGGPATVTPPNGVNAVNVREVPNGTILKRLPRGAEVEIVGGCGDQIAAGIVAPRPGQNDGQKPVQGWCAISRPVIGCVAEQFLAAGFPAGDLGPAAGIIAPEPPRDNFKGDRPDGMTARVVKDVNLRTGPSAKDTKVITQLHHGIKVGVTECKPSWCRVTTPGNMRGWVSKDYLRFENDDAFDGGEPQFEPQRDAPFDDGLPKTSSCNIPGGIATVSIPQANIDHLNVREVPDGAILGRVPEGAQVNVVGGCGEQFAAGIVAQKPAGNGGQTGAPGWCAITSPMVGCVSEKFLIAGIPTGDQAPAAGIVAARPQSGRTFTGTWDATAQGAAYTITLDHDGNTVSGSYTSSDGSSGTINGKVRNNVLRFSWDQDDLSGTGKFALSEDANSFRGSFSLGDNPDVIEGSWNGRRRQ